MPLRYFEWNFLTLTSIQAKGFFSKPSLKNKTTVFSVGTRGDVLGQVYYLGHIYPLYWCLLLQELEAPIIVPHSQQKTEQKYPFEMLFRSIQVNSWLFLMIYIFVSVRNGGQRLPRVFVCVRVLYPGRQLCLGDLQQHLREDNSAVGEAHRQSHQWQLWLHLHLPLYPPCPGWTENPGLNKTITPEMGRL